MSRWLAAVFLSIYSLLAAAQGYPERPVKLIVPLPPGGSPDTIARVLSQGLQGVWPHPVVVENRTGGSQNIGADAVAKAAPDGYTWLLSPDNVFAVNPHIAKQSFDPLNDLAAVVSQLAYRYFIHAAIVSRARQRRTAHDQSWASSTAPKPYRRR